MESGYAQRPARAVSCRRRMTLRDGRAAPRFETARDSRQRRRQAGGLCDDVQDGALGLQSGPERGVLTPLCGARLATLIRFSVVKASARAARSAAQLGLMRLST